MKKAVAMEVLFCDPEQFPSLYSYMLPSSFSSL